MVYECFPTLEVFASYLKGSSNQCYPYRHNVVNSEDCGDLACGVIHGKVRFFTHLFFNYRNILFTKLPTRPTRELLVLRQEKLWEDWVELNARLGQPRESVYIPPSSTNERNVSGLVLPVTREISSVARLKLCKALEPEYAAYFQILRRASNIGNEEVLYNKNIAKKNCPNLDMDTW